MLCVTVDDVLAFVANQDAIELPTLSSTELGNSIELQYKEPKAIGHILSEN
jgi:hypothetical protein